MKKTVYSIASYSKRYKYLLLALALFLLVPFFAGFYYFIVKDLPSPTTLSGTSASLSTHIYDRNGTLLYTIYGNKNQTFVPLNKIPKHIQQATIAIEDKTFYQHGAVDFKGIARAFIYTFYHKQLQGGSTLTQQLVKNSLLTPDRTWERKIKEVILSFATELLYSKDQILEMYLNQVPYGGTVYGVEAAAQTFFNKKVHELSLAESALIAGLPEAPSIFSPFENPQYAKKRQEEVLANMLEEGYITKAEHANAVAQPLTYKEDAQTIHAPHFVLWVKELLAEKYGREVVAQGGLTVKTSLDLPLQEYAQATVAAEIDKLGVYAVSNGAALITRPNTGEILAMVGSKDYFDETIDGNVNLTVQERQPGSSIKPINYATGLAKGYTTATPLVDSQKCFPNPGQAPYCPVNYDGAFHGVTQMRSALANSYNIPAVKMLKLNGLDAMIATASAMGISSFTDPDRYGLSLTLGGGEVMMTELATAFGVFANQGYRIDLHPILEVKDAKGKILEKYTPPSSPIFGKKVLSPGIAFIISHILSDNGARTPAFGPNSELRIGNLPIAVKTGTTNDYRDNWTIGYTPEWLVAVWVGNNNNTPMRGVVSGVTGAAPIWHDVMAHLVAEQAVSGFKQPDSVVGKHICTTSGLLPTGEGPDRCPTRYEYFLKGTEPKRGDPGRQKVIIDKATNDLAAPGKTDNIEERMEIVVTDPLGDRYCVTCPHPQPSPTP